MTSQEIRATYSRAYQLAKEHGDEEANKRLPLWEIAYQLAVMNELEREFMERVKPESLADPIRQGSETEVRGENLASGFPELYLAAKRLLVTRAGYGSEEFEGLRNAVHAVSDKTEDAMAAHFSAQPGSQDPPTSDNPILPGGNEL